MILNGSDFVATLPRFANILDLGAITVWIAKVNWLDHIAAPSLLAGLGRGFEGVLPAIF